MTEQVEHVNRILLSRDIHVIAFLPNVAFGVAWERSPRQPQWIMEGVRWTLEQNSASDSRYCCVQLLPSKAIASTLHGCTGTGEFAVLWPSVVALERMHMHIYFQYSTLLCIKDWSNTT